MKRLFSLFLTLALLLSLAVPALAFKVVVSSQALSVNGETIDCERYNIDDSNYFKLRDIAYLLNGTGSQFDVGWDPEKGVASITTNHPYTNPNGTELVVGADKSATAVVSSQTIMIDGVVRDDLKVYNIGGNNFFQLREMGDALGFDVGYDAAARTMLVTSRDTASGLKVTDFCSVMGTFASGTDNTAFSYVLPEVSGADTPCVREINGRVREIYETSVLPSLSSMDRGEYPTCFCVSYLYAEHGGVHSLLITADSDWDLNYYWCFNFNSRGEKVENEAVLRAAGLTPESFLSVACDYLKGYTDISEYFEDDGWKQYQDATLAPENLNASNPMVILPDGNLCFVATIHSPAGAEFYDKAFEIAADGTVSPAGVGRTLLNRLTDGSTGTYLIRAPRVSGDEFAEDALLELFTIGDTLMMETTNYDSETGSVYSYSATEIFPEDPAALLRADVDSIRVGLAQYSPDVFTGSYFGEASACTLSVTEDGIAFTDAAGGVLNAVRCYDDALWPDKGLPEADPGKFSYDDVAAAGIAGVWTGAYRDEAFRFHSLTLELTSWGQLRMRDSLPGAIPRVMEGSFYIAGVGDDMAPAGAVVFNLTRRGGYKQPFMGYAALRIDDGGDLEIIEAEESSCRLTQVNPYLSTAVLRRVPTLRKIAAPSVLALKENECAHVDTEADGTPEEISYVFVRDDEGENAITGLTVTVEGKAFTLDCMYAYTADVYLIDPGISGAAYLYVDGLGDSDCHFISVISVRPGDARWVGEFAGGFDGVPADAGALRLTSRFSLLSATQGTATYRVGPSGMPEALDAFYRIDTPIELTSKRNIDCWAVDALGGPIGPETLPAGSVVTFVRTDGATFVDLLTQKGDTFRVWIDQDFTIPQRIGGVDVADCFDGVFFAG